MSRLPPHLQTTLDTLRTHATDGECQMALSELAQARGISRRTLHRHIAALENLGYLTIHRRPGQSSSYQLTAGGQGVSRITRRLRRLLPEVGERKDASAPPRLRPEKTVGRQHILTALHENVAKRRHTLLVGPLGIGKSHLLRHFATRLEQRSTGDRGTRGQEPALRLST